MDTTTMTPVEIDTELARIYGEAMVIEARIASEVKFIERQTKRANQAPLTSWDQANLDNAKVRLAKYQEQRQAYIAEKAPFEVEYSKRPWNRYFLVTNSNGHVHRGMNCSTCYPTTEYAWVVDLADCDEAKMVEEYGENACTVCFPNAPSLPSFRGPGRRNQVAKDARAAERQAKADAKAAKAITAPDGSPLKIDTLMGQSETIATEVTARRELSKAYVDSIQADEARQEAEAKGEAEGASWAETRRQVYVANMALLIEAIAAKHGQTVEEVQAEVQPSLDRALKAYRKEQAHWQAHFAARGL
jgi:hypothetical protein